MVDPVYEFTTPSLFDGVLLDCRVYHPESLNTSLEDPDCGFKAAVIAHPYAPLGGSYDDPVVLSVTECLLQQQFVVGTFNFRGAAGSEGKTSWTGKSEIEDYVSFAGFMFYYLLHLRSFDNLNDVRPAALSGDDLVSTRRSASNPSSHPMRLLLAGYSFGSLVLARLPPVASIISRFESAERESKFSEIFLRARTLAKNSRQAARDERRPRTAQEAHPILGDPSSSPSQRPRASSVRMGGEEGNSSDRRHSRDSKKSADLVREIPQRIRNHIRKHSGTTREALHEKQNSHGQSSGREHEPRAVLVQYLLVSPVLLPMTTTLAPPGVPFTTHRVAGDTHGGIDSGGGLLSLKWPSLAVFGSSDTFTSGQKLQHWAAKLNQDSNAAFEWTMINGAGHFWREEGAMSALKARIVTWVAKIESEANPQ